MHPSFNDVISAMKIATCTVSLFFYAAAFFHLAFYSFVTRVTQSSSERCFLMGNKQGRPLRVDPFMWHLQHFGLRRLNVRMLRGCSSMELKNFWAMNSKIFGLKMENFLAISWISELKNFWAHLLAQKFFG